MTNCLLHVRLTRAATTYGPADYAPLVRMLDQFAPDAVRAETMGTNAIVFAIEWRENPAILARLLQPALDREPFEDWCLVEVGRGAAWMSGEGDIDPDDEDEDDGGAVGRFLDTCPNHGPVNTYGARGLLMELDRDIDHRHDRFLDNLQRRLGLYAGRHWHSRSMALLAFHDRRKPADIAPALAKFLDDDCVLDWTLFTLGSQIASKAGMSSLNGWLDKAYRLDRGLAVFEPRNPAPRVRRMTADARLGGPKLRERAR